MTWTTYPHATVQNNFHKPKALQRVDQQTPMLLLPFAVSGFVEMQPSRDQISAWCLLYLLKRHFCATEGSKTPISLPFINCRWYIFSSIVPTGQKEASAQNFCFETTQLHCWLYAQVIHLWSAIGRSCIPSFARLSKPAPWLASPRQDSSRSQREQGDLPRSNSALPRRPVLRADRPTICLSQAVTVSYQWTRQDIQDTGLCMPVQ